MAFKLSTVDKLPAGIALVTSLLNCLGRTERF